MMNKRLYRDYLRLFLSMFFLVIYLPHLIAYLCSKHKNQINEDCRQTGTDTIKLKGVFALRYIEEPITIKVIRESRFWKYMLCVLFGYYIHNSILVIAFLYPLIPVLQRLKPRWWYLILIVSLFFVGNFIDLGQIGIVSSYLFNERYANYGTVYESSMSSSAFIMQLILFIMCFVVLNKLINQDSRTILLINLVFVGLVFQSLAGMIAEMFRMSYYFSIFYIILIPRVLRILSNNGKEPIYSIGFSILGLFFLFFLSSAHMPEYHFFF